LSNTNSNRKKEEDHRGIIKTWSVPFEGNKRGNKRKSFVPPGRGPV